MLTHIQMIDALADLGREPFFHADITLQARRAAEAGPMGCFDEAFDVDVLPGNFSIHRAAVEAAVNAGDLATLVVALEAAQDAALDAAAAAFA